MARDLRSIPLWRAVRDFCAAECKEVPHITAENMADLFMEQYWLDKVGLHRTMSDDEYAEAEEHAARVRDSREGFCED